MPESAKAWIPVCNTTLLEDKGNRIGVTSLEELGVRGITWVKVGSMNVIYHGAKS